MCVINNKYMVNNSALLIEMYTTYIYREGDLRNARCLEMGKKKVSKSHICSSARAQQQARL